MKLFSRISATVLAGVDRTVSHVENHDAVIEASLKETQRAAARARVRLQRVKRDGETLRSTQDALKNKIEHWTQRAKDNHEVDRTLALQCLARRKQCISEEQELQTLISQHVIMEDRLTTTIVSIEKRATQMSQQRNQMRSRESTAEAQWIISRVDNIETGGVDDIFERWDLSISETEISAGTPVDLACVDALEEQFNSIENEAELEAELNALIGRVTHNDRGRDQ